ncbi:glycosyl transferase family 2 [Capsulimonas corticalis]|uniref:Glycosyl transferase family 2 n=1 Tax=Capsulimonas corticalis TaxID=2219043 RepID=A0A402CP22_9BACT|nr:glycosyltransferase [Capsulimonas corticalis]BDI33197.1 glycosyl transferase family 2 [Capsulimonas corticalis]
MSTHDPQQKPIFYDESQRRGGVLSFMMYALAMFCIVGAAVFLISIAGNPVMTASPIGGSPTRGPHGLVNMRLAPRPALPDVKQPADLRNKVLRTVLRGDNEVQETQKRLSATIRRERAVTPIPPAAIAPGHIQGPVRAAFYVNFEKNSIDSLREHIDQTTHLMPVWVEINPQGSDIKITRDISTRSGGSQVTLGETYDDEAIRLARTHGVPIIPVVQNATEGEFHGEWVHALVNDPHKRAAMIEKLRAFIVKNGYQGVNIDFETDSADDADGLTAFMTELGAVFHPLGLLVTQDIQTDSATYDLPTLGKCCDFIIPMIYDEHGDGTHDGPVASWDWFQTELDDVLAEVPADKVVLGIANYGYDWSAGSTSPDDVTFEQACQTAKDSMDGEDGVIKIDRGTLSPYFTYYDDSNGQGDKEIAHKVWLEDAASAYNKLIAGEHHHLLGAALWRLGSEDPSLWRYFNHDHPNIEKNFDLHALTDVTYNYFGTSFIGQGDVLYVKQAPTKGKRNLTVDPKTKLIVGETFSSYPSQYVIQRTGKVDQQNGANKDTVALTFDDGPDPRWTPQILTILHKYHVPATFFVVGENAQANPGLLTREWNEGMEIGNHSFTHPEIDQISSPRIKLELDATQRVIEALTGHMTTLFRAPNRADSEPSTPADFDPILQAHKLGYVFIGEQVDPTDWKPGIKADQIVSFVLNHAHEGNCVLLHDAGGDTRAETIKALPRIIEGLQKQGFHFVTVSNIMGRTRDQVFPAISPRQRVTAAINRAFIYGTYVVGTVLTGLFLLAIFLGIARIAIMGVLATIQARKEKARAFEPDFLPSVSVIIAAYNEAKVVNKTIATLLASHYPRLDILVVDDGSRDGTADVVRAKYGQSMQVQVISKPNGGKASALNLGIQKCSGEIIVALDADTVFTPDTIGNLVRHFADSQIGAVSGNVKVGNRKNAWTIWQAVEYITSQNFDRRAFDLLNCITVVPGAVGAWRRDAVVLAGMYSSQTLAEDTDLTLKVRKLGYKIVTDNDALAYTEAPDGWRDLIKQRYRWAFGTLQCLWKHRDALGNKRYGALGTVAMPSLWLYQIVFQAIAPLVDIGILWAMFTQFIIKPTTDHTSLFMLLGYWAVFSTVEMAGAALAFHLDREDKRLIAWLPLQRFAYRQLMYVVILKSLRSALFGRRVGWGKLERKGTVTTPKGRDTLLGGGSEQASPEVRS